MKGEGDRGRGRGVNRRARGLLCGWQWEGGGMGERGFLGVDGAGEEEGEGTKKWADRPRREVGKDQGIPRYVKRVGGKLR